MSAHDAWKLGRAACEDSSPRDDAIEQRMSELQRDPEMLAEALGECWDRLSRENVAAIAAELCGVQTGKQLTAFHECMWALAEADYDRDDRSWLADAMPDLDDAYDAGMGLGVRGAA